MLSLMANSHLQHQLNSSLTVNSHHQFWSQVYDVTQINSCRCELNIKLSQKALAMCIARHCVQICSTLQYVCNCKNSVTDLARCNWICNLSHFLTQIITNPNRVPIPIYGYTKFQNKNCQNSDCHNRNCPRTNVLSTRQKSLTWSEWVVS